MKGQAYNALCDMFHDNYIAELRNFRNSSKPSTDQCLQVGMMVLYRVRGLFKKDKAGDRRKWRLARIVKLHPSPRDARVRSVDLAVYDHTYDQTKILKSQSIQNIAIFESTSVICRI